MELIYKGKLLSLSRPISIKCSDGKEYRCTQKNFPMSFKIYEGDQLLVEGISQYSAIWQVTDTQEKRRLFTTCGKWGRFAIEVEGKKIKDNEFEEVFGWRPISCSGFYSWGLEFPQKEKYLMELAYGYLKDHWQGD